MAEFGIGLAVEVAKLALTAAAGKICREASCIRHFEDDFRQLQQRLDDLHLYFRDTDRTPGNKEQSELIIRKLLRELESAATEAQDIIDLSVVQGLVSGPFSHPFPSSSRFMISFHGFLGKVQSVPVKRQISLQIQKMNAILDKIEARARTFGSLLGPHNVGTCLSCSNYDDLLRRAEVIYKEDTSVDILPKMQEIECLINKHRVVAVVGMAGSGKTRLLQHVFQSIKSRYEVAIWLSVSGTFTIRQLQVNVLGRLREQLRLDSAAEDSRFDDHGESVDSLQAKIHAGLKNRKYLVVFDDVWELQGYERSYCLDVMQKLSLVGLPEHDSRFVLVSTRNFEVASQFGAHVYRMPLLSHKHSRDLFFRHLLPLSQLLQTQELSSDHEAVINQAVRKCSGLPLAVITIAGLFRHQNPEEWPITLKRMQSSSSSSDDAHQSVVTTALMLSFNDLDYRVKPCFVFLGMFAEDEEIDSDKLIGMWIAEGNVKCHKDGFRLLMHLCNRCLLQLERKIDYGYYRSQITTRVIIHDLVHDLAVRLCRETGGICAVSWEENMYPPDGAWQLERISRMSLSKAGITSIIPFTMACTRSLHVLRLDCNENFFRIPSEILAPAVALRALDLSQTSVASLPYCVRNFLLLKYLDISGSGIEKLPECLRNLKSLKYLYTSIQVEVPRWIGDLQQLQYLGGGYWASWKDVFRKPQKLISVEGININLRSKENGWSNKQNVGRWTWNALSQLMHLEVLNRLCIDGFEDGCIPPETLRYLSLRLEHDAVVTFPDEWQLRLHQIQYLFLDGINFPEQIQGFRNLSTLCLYNIFLVDDYPDVICNLPELRELSLIGSNCKQLPQEFGRPGAFPKLQTLCIFHLRKLSKLPDIEPEAMPCLRDLSIRNCPGLREAVGWSQKVTALQILYLDYVFDGVKAELMESYASRHAASG